MVKWLNARVSVALPEDEYERIKRHPEIKWGAIARKALIMYLNEIEKVKETSPEELKQMLRGQEKEVREQ
jgi:hypothetical protein